jgi:catechol 2,3-dioxygenase-like lactoylglutathione lyase family enzyme
MANPFQATRDVIISTDAWQEATTFYRSVLGLTITCQTNTLVGFETGTFQLYVEKGRRHGPVFEFLVADVQAAKQLLLSSGCTVEEEDASIPRCYLRDPYGLVFNIGPASAKT